MQDIIPNSFQMTSRVFRALLLVGALSGSLVSCADNTLTPNEQPTFQMKNGQKTTSGGGSTSTTIPMETEPNDDGTMVHTIIGSILGGSIRGVISSATDVDYASTHAILPGKELSVSLTVPAGKDYDVQILDYDNLTVLASAHAGAGSKESIRYKNPTNSSNSYKLRVISYDGSFSETATYTLTVGKTI
jgi:hypothetical protein